MSRFFSSKYEKLTPYTPGEQPGDAKKYIKLNTNESPFPPSPAAMEYARTHTRPLNLYSDPTAAELTGMLAERYGVSANQVLVTNGSDEILNFAFMAFCDGSHPAVFPDITYGFYPVFSALNGAPYREIPLEDDFSINPESFFNAKGTIFIANPNAPTGKYLPLAAIAAILESNPENVVVIDEAYIDFGGESALTLLPEHPNLLVTQTFSKSRSMAGARLGYGIGSPGLIADLNTMKYSTNPYNINSMSIAAGIGVLKDREYTDRCCGNIMENRAYLASELGRRGFLMTDSLANFLFVKHPDADGEKLYLELKKRGVLVRHFSLPRIRDYNRITIGTREQLDVLLAAVDEILQG